jgi:serine/threonine protein phosphatase PrpC
MNLSLRAAGKSDVGVVRNNNEDNFGFDTRSGIFVVCDGMGGQAAGERASKIGVDTILQHFRRPPGNGKDNVLGTVFEGMSERANALARAVQLANQAIRQEAAQSPSKADMGSTIVGLAIEGNYFSVANVGDSRIYLIRGAAIELLTEDHSVVMEQVRRGLMTHDEAEHSSMQNVIVRALGSEDSVEPDLADHELLAGDLLLLCSDGLTRHLTDGAIFSIATASDNLAKICDDLIQAAKDGGSDDNITCLVVRAAEPSWRDRVFGKGRQSQGSI